MADHLVTSDARTLAYRALAYTLLPTVPVGTKLGPFTVIGSGMWRHSLLGPDGLVYKVPTRDVMVMFGEHLLNRCHVEVERTERWQHDVFLNSGGTVRLAEVAIVMPYRVTVSEFVRGSGPDLSTWAQSKRISAAIRRIFEVTDFCPPPSNFVVDEDGGLVLVDMLHRC